MCQVGACFSDKATTYLCKLAHIKRVPDLFVVSKQTALSPIDWSKMFPGRGKRVSDFSNDFRLNSGFCMLNCQ